jgi:hypothetical protein
VSDIYAAGDTNQIRCGDTIMGLNSAANELNRLTRDLAAANATVEKCKAAGFIDEQGEVRKVLGTLPITADGAIANADSYVYHPSQIESAVVKELSVASMHDSFVNNKNFPLSEDCNHVGVAGYYEPDTGYAEQYVFDVRDCYSTRTAAEAAREGKENT